MLLLSVSDTGRGIEEAIRERVFLPFFTTKRDRGAADSGWPTVFSTVRASGGTDLVGWRLTPRTTIRVLLPRAATAAVPIRSAGRADPGVRATGKRCSSSRTNPRS
jgi:signal transduction histidine kinase